MYPPGAKRRWIWAPARVSWWRPCCIGFAQASGVELNTSQVQLAKSHGCQAVRQGEGGQALADMPDGSLDLVV